MFIDKITIILLFCYLVLIVIMTIYSKRILSELQREREEKHKFEEKYMSCVARHSDKICVNPVDKFLDDDIFGEEPVKCLSSPMDSIEMVASEFIPEGSMIVMDSDSLVAKSLAVSSVPMEMGLLNAPPLRRTNYGLDHLFVDVVKPESVAYMTCDLEPKKSMFKMKIKGLMENSFVGSLKDDR